MTNEQAQVILNECKSENPSFIRGSRKYIVRNDGRIDIWLSVGKSGLRWKSYQTVEGSEYYLPLEVRLRAKERLAVL